MTENTERLLARGRAVLEARRTLGSASLLYTSDQRERLQQRGRCLLDTHLQSRASSQEPPPQQRGLGMVPGIDPETLETIAGHVAAGEAADSDSCSPTVLEGSRVIDTSVLDSVREQYREDILLIEDLTEECTALRDVVVAQRGELHRLTMAGAASEDSSKSASAMEGSRETDPALQQELTTLQQLLADRDVEIQRLQLELDRDRGERKELNDLVERLTSAVREKDESLVAALGQAEKAEAEVRRLCALVSSPEDTASAELLTTIKALEQQLQQAAAEKLQLEEKLLSASSCSGKPTGDVGTPPADGDIVSRAECDAQREQLIAQFNEHIQRCDAMNREHWEKMIAKHNGELAKLAAERDEARAAAAAARTSASTAVEGQVPSLPRSPPAPAVEATTELEEQLRLAEAQASSLKEELRVLQEAHRESLEDLRDQLVRATSQLADMEQQRLELCNTNNALEGELAAAAMLRQSIEQQLVEEREAAATASSIQRAEVSANEVATARECDELRCVLQAARERCGELEGALVAAQRQLQDAQEEVGALMRHNATTGAALSESDAKVGQLQGEVARIASQLSDEQRLREAVESELREVKELAEEGAVLRTEIAALKASMADMEEASQTALKNLAMELESEREGHFQTSDDVQRLTDLIVTRQEELRRVLEERDGLEAEKAELRAQLAEAAARSSAELVVAEAEHNPFALPSGAITDVPQVSELPPSATSNPFANATGLTSLNGSECGADVATPCARSNERQEVAEVEQVSMADMEEITRLRTEADEVRRALEAARLMHEKDCQQLREGHQQKVDELTMQLLQAEEARREWEEERAALVHTVEALRQQEFQRGAFAPPGANEPDGAGPAASPFSDASDFNIWDTNSSVSRRTGTEGGAHDVSAMVPPQQHPGQGLQENPFATVGGGLNFPRGTSVTESDISELQQQGAEREQDWKERLVGANETISALRESLAAASEENKELQLRLASLTNELGERKGQEGTHQRTVGGEARSTQHEGAPTATISPTLPSNPFALSTGAETKWGDEPLATGNSLSENPFAEALPQGGHAGFLEEGDTEPPSASAAVHRPSPPYESVATVEELMKLSYLVEKLQNNLEVEKEAYARVCDELHELRQRSGYPSYTGTCDASPAAAASPLGSAPRNSQGNSAELTLGVDSPTTLHGSSQAEREALHCSSTADGSAIASMVTPHGVGDDNRNPFCDLESSVPLAEPVEPRSSQVDMDGLWSEAAAELRQQLEEERHLRHVAEEKHALDRDQQRENDAIVAELRNRVIHLEAECEEIRRAADSEICEVIRSTEDEMAASVEKIRELEATVAELQQQLACKPTGAESSENPFDSFGARENVKDLEAFSLVRELQEEISVLREEQMALKRAHEAEMLEIVTLAQKRMDDHDELLRAKLAELQETHSNCAACATRCSQDEAHHASPVESEVARTEVEPPAGAVTAFGGDLPSASHEGLVESHHASGAESRRDGAGGQLAEALAHVAQLTQELEDERRLRGEAAPSERQEAEAMVQALEAEVEELRQALMEERQHYEEEMELVVGAAEEKIHEHERLLQQQLGVVLAGIHKDDEEQWGPESSADGAIPAAARDASEATLEDVAAALQEKVQAERYWRQQCENVSDNLSKLRDVEARLMEQLRERQEHVEALQRRIVGLEQHVSQLQSHLDLRQLEIGDVHSSATDRIEELKKQLAEFDVHFNALQDDVRQRDNELREVRAAEAEHRAACEALIEDLREKISQKDRDLRDLRAAHDNAEYLIKTGAAKIEAAMRDKQRELDALTEAVEQRNQRVNAVQEQLAARDAEIERLQAQLDDYLCREASLELENRDGKNRYAIASKSLEDLARDATERHERLQRDRELAEERHKEQLAALHLEHQREVSSLRDEIDGLRSEVQVFQAIAATLPQEMKKSEGQLTSLREQLEEAQRRSSDLTAELKAAAQRAAAERKHAVGGTNDQDDSSAQESRINALSDRNEELEAKIRRLGREKDALLQERDTLSAELLNAGRMMEVKDSALKRQETEVMQSRVQVQVLKDDLVQRLNQNNALRQDAASLEAYASEMARACSELEATVHGYRSSSTLLAAVESLYEAKAVSLARECATFFHGVANIHHGIVSATNKSRLALVSRCDAIEQAATEAMAEADKQTSELRDELARATTRQEELQESVERMRAELGAAKKAKESTAEELQAARTELADCMRTAHEELYKMQRDLQAAQLDQAASLNMVSLMKEENANLQRLMAQQKLAADEAYAALLADTERLREVARVRSEESRQQRDDLDTKYVQMTQLVEECQRQAAEEANNARALQATLDRALPRLEQLEEEKAKREAQLLETSRQLTALSRKADSDSQVSIRHIEQMTLALQESTADLERFQQESIQHATLAGRLKTKLDGMELERERNKAQIDRLQHELGVAQGSIRDLESQRSREQSELSGKLVTSERLLHASEQRCGGLAAQNQELLENLRESQASQKEIAEELRQAREEFRVTSAQQGKRITVLTDRSEDTARELEQLKKVHSDIHGANEALRRDKASLKDELVRARQHLAEANRHAERLNSELRAANESHDAELEETKRTLWAAKNEISNLRQSMVAVEARQSELNDLIDCLQSDNQRLKNDVASAKSVHNEEVVWLTRDRNEKQEVINLLQAQIAELNEEIHEKSQELMVQRAAQVKLTEDVTILRQQLESEVARSGKLSRELQDMSRLLSEAREELRCYRVEVEGELADAKGALAEKVAELKQLSEKTGAKLEVYRVSEESLRQELVYHMKRIQQLEMQLETARSAILNSELGGELDQRKVKALQDEVESLKQRLSASDEEAAKLRAELQECLLNSERMKRKFAADVEAMEQTAAEQRRVDREEMEGLVQRERKLANDAKEARERANQSLQRLKGEYEEIDDELGKARAEMRVARKESELAKTELRAMKAMAQQAAAEVGILDNLDRGNDGGAAESCSQVSFVQIMDQLLATLSEYHQSSGEVDQQRSQLDGVAKILAEHRRVASDVNALCLRVAEVYQQDSELAGSPGCDGVPSTPRQRSQFQLAVYSAASPKPGPHPFAGVETPAQAFASPGTNPSPLGRARGASPLPQPQHVHAALQAIDAGVRSSLSFATHMNCHLSTAQSRLRTLEENYRTLAAVERSAAKPRPVVGGGAKVLEDGKAAAVQQKVFLSCTMSAMHSRIAQQMKLLGILQSYLLNVLGAMAEGSGSPFRDAAGVRGATYDSADAAIGSLYPAYVRDAIAVLSQGEHYSLQNFDALLHGGEWEADAAAGTGWSRAVGIVSSQYSRAAGFSPSPAPFSAPSASPAASTVDTTRTPANHHHREYADPTAAARFTV